MAAITICSDFGAQKNKVSHCFPTSKEWWLCRRRKAERSYSTFKARRGSGEETTLIQGKRNPSKTVVVCERASEGRHTETIITAS